MFYMFRVLWCFVGFWTGSIWHIFFRIISLAPTQFFDSQGVSEATRKIWITYSYDIIKKLLFNQTKPTTTRTLCIYNATDCQPDFTRNSLTSWHYLRDTKHMINASGYRHGWHLMLSPICPKLPDIVVISPLGYLIITQQHPTQGLSFTERLAAFS